MFGNTPIHFQSPELRAALTAAETRVIARLERRPTLSTTEVIAATGVPDAQKSQADRLLFALSEVLRVSPGKLRPDDILAELLGVDGDELAVDQAAVLRKYGLSSRVEVFWYKHFRCDPVSNRRQSCRHAGERLHGTNTERRRRLYRSDAFSASGSTNPLTFSCSQALTATADRKKNPTGKRWRDFFTFWSPIKPERASRDTAAAANRYHQPKPRVHH